MQAFKKKSIVLLHGIFQDEVFKNFSKNDGDFYVLEGRPDLKSSKLTVKSLLKKRITPTIISDNMPGFLFYKDMVREVRMSYQNIDSSGALCDMGSLILGVLAKVHKVPVNLYPGQLRQKFLASQEDVLKFNGDRVTPIDVRTYGPLVEWVSNEYITKLHS